MPVPFGASILVLAAHPDDEVVACCAAIGRARAAGARVHVLYLTHGCLARQTLWPWDRPRYDAIVARRRAEADAVATALGVTPAGWSPRAARELWPDLRDVHAEIAAAVAANGVTQLWAPAYEGGNPDHDALNAVASRFSDLSVLEFAEYNFSGGQARSQTFPRADGAEETLVLTSSEQAAKRSALGLYVSERGNLNYVKTERECFRPLATYDYAQPPHAGRLWYARFQWVPFRHPQVDFTRAAEVSRAITEFLARPA